MFVSVGICAHVSRTEMAAELQDQLDGCPVAMDDGSVGGAINHDRAFYLAAQLDSDWVICMEDDALPVEGFYKQASMALTVAPTPVVSLYHGWIQDPDPGTVERIATGAHWIMRRALATTVCTCVRRDIFPAFMKAAEEVHPDRPCDMRYEIAALATGQERFAYSCPSLVEHHDGQTVHYTGAVHIPRRAYKVGTRPEWNDSQAVMW